MKAFGFIGYSNSGKTTLIERVIPLFRERGFAVSAIKMPTTDSTWIARARTLSAIGRPALGRC